MSDNRGPLWQRYRDLLRRRTNEDVDDELRFHLDMRVDEARRMGLSDREARDAANERFGDVRPVEAELLRMNAVRERRHARTELLSDLRRDIAFAIRSLRRAPTFAAAAIATLAIAIGANTAIYSVVHALLVAPLPYARSSELVAAVGWGWSNGELLALRQQWRSVAGVAAYNGWSANLDDGATAERLDGAAVSGNFFSLLETPPIVGRTLAADENDPGRTHVLVLSEALWRGRFGGDTAAIGRRVLIDGVPTMIVGVMPAAFAFPDATTAFWLPFEIDRASAVSMWANGSHHFIARLRRGTGIDAARREIQRIAPSLRHANVMWDPGPSYGMKANLEALQDSLVGGTRTSLILLLGCAGLVLLIACVNVANLLLARATARERELAVRAALGGGRSRLIRQLLAESVVLAAAGGAVGVALAAGGVKWIVAALPAGVPRSSEIALNGAALGFTAAVAILTGIAFGLLPAFRATRPQSTTAIRSGRTGNSVGHQRASAMLVVGEVALAVLLAVGAELFVRSFRDVRRLDPGFRTSRIISARVTPATVSFSQPGKADVFYATVLSRAGAMPGVESVGGVTALPLAQPAYSMGIRVEGQFEDAKRTLPSIDHLQYVTPGYMPTIGIPLLVGRPFGDDDGAAAEPVALISESAAKHFWPDGSAIGKRIGYPYESPWMRVVGIVADTKSDNLRETGAMAVYLPFAQRSRAFRGQPELTLVVRTAGDPALIGHAIAALITSVDRSVPVSDIRTMDDVISRSLAWPRFTMSLVAGFAIVALVLGAVGIYGVMSYVVSQRAQELSIRVALGAAAKDIRMMVLGRAAALAGAGALLGISAAVVAVRPLRTLLYGVSPNDPLSYAAVGILFVGVAIVASAGPARRAAGTSPASVLRGD